MLSPLADPVEIDLHGLPKFSRYKAPEKQRPDGAAGAFGTGDTGGRYSTGTVVALSLSVQDRIPTAVRPALFPYPIH